MIVDFVADHAQVIAAGVFGLSFLCGLVVNLTPTPPPSSRFAHVYRVIELGANVWGYAKDHGLVSPTPQLAAAASQAVALGNEVIATLRAKPNAPATSKVAADGLDSVRAMIAVLRAEGVLPPRTVAPEVAASPPAPIQAPPQ